MARPLSRYNIENVKDEKERSERIGAQLKSYFDILNSGITFQDNIRGRVIDVVFSAANSEVAVSHGLNITPTGFISVKPTAAMVLYDSGKAWDKNNVYLKSSAIGTARIFLF